MGQGPKRRRRLIWAPLRPHSHRHAHRIRCLDRLSLASRILSSPPEENRNSLDSGPFAVEESLQAQIDSLEQQLKTRRQEVHNNKYVVSRLAGKVKSLNRDLADKMEENAELMLRLASED